MAEAKTLAHFRDRSESYNRSSNWVHDQALLDRMFELAEVKGDETVVDLATGTGLVAKQFRGRSKQVIGVDISPDMTRQALPHLDQLVIAPLESLPLATASADCCVCRQGLQFTRLDRATAEIARVLRTGGRAVFCHLAAYGEEDKAEAFKVQELRNPARVNFFLPGTLEAMLERHGLRVTTIERYLSRESVNQWIDHGAIDHDAMDAIREVYRRAGPAFRRIHEIEFAGDDIFDTMLMLIVRAEKQRE